MCVPIVFTEYMIAVPNKSVDLPKFINKLGIPDFSTPQKLPELGHAGCLFINGKTGLTKYYEYGRYDAAELGLTRNVGAPDLKIRKDGTPDWDSLRKVLHSISAKSGQGGRISAAWIAAAGKFDAMLKYAETRRKENADAARKKYNLITNSCNHFMKGVMEAAGLRTPIMVDMRPTSYINEIRDLYPPLDYNPRNKKLVISGKVPA